MEGCTEYFEQCISQWLEGEKSKDADFAKKVEESKKDVKGCCNFIIKQVKESKQCGYADGGNESVCFFDVMSESLKDVLKVLTEYKEV